MTQPTMTPADFAAKAVGLPVLAVGVILVLGSLAVLAGTQ